MRASLAPITLAAVLTAAGLAFADDGSDDTETSGEGTDSTTGTESSETGTEPWCGDGNVDPNEFCDDGNQYGLDE